MLFRSLLRVLFVIIYCVSKNPTVFFFLIAILLGVYSILFVNAKPYKKSIYNTADSFVMIVLHLMVVSALVAYVGYQYPHILQIFIAYFLFAFVFLLLYINYWLFVHIMHVARRYWRRIRYEGTVVLQ